MDIYTAIHDNLVNSRKHLKEEWKPVSSGLYRHRILPAHQGGTYDDESNCTYLTSREHIIVHWLLWKIHGNHGDLIAWTMLKGFKYPAPTEETRRKMSETHKGMKHTEESLCIMREKAKGVNNGFYGKKHSEESLHKMSISSANISDETRRKIAEKSKGKNNGMYGRKHSEETLRRIREGMKRAKESKRRTAANPLEVLPTILSK
jgi:hypothetical protein|tara:strand:- start:180 stop:794 length:615 start_codon:yes stop_codon:yes gene_type:complete